MDNYIADGLDNLAPHKSVFDMDAPKKVSKNLSIPKPVISSTALWLDNTDAIKDASKLKWMEKLAMQ